VEPQIDVEQLYVEDLGVETSTQEQSSKDGRKRTREAYRLFSNAKENVGAPMTQLENIDRGVGELIFLSN